MQDPWKYVGFSVSAIVGYFVSAVATQPFMDAAGLSKIPSTVLVLGITGFLAGFTIDELIPAYLDKVGGSSGNNNMDGDFDSGDDDFNFE